jgi:peptidoglycan/LPS O-acetylase OafA/YrhL
MNPSRNIAPLTSLRFVAAGAIVLHHSFGFKFFQESFPIGQHFLGIWVSFFYVLSGFILTYVHPQLPTAGETRHFWVARVARIWPLHVTCFLIMVLTLPLGKQWNSQPVTESAKAVLNLLMLQSWVPIPQWFFSFNSVSWSISVELFFYAMFPWLIIGIQRNWAFKLLLAAGIIVACCIAGTLMQWPPAPSPETLGQPSGLMLAFPPTRLLEFTLGIVACAIVRQRPLIANFISRRATLCEVGSLLLLVAGVLTMSTVQGFLYSGSPFLATYYPQGGLAWVFAIMVLVFSFEAGLLSRLLSWNVLVYLGEISYGVYLLHQILMRLLQRFFKTHPDASPWLAYAIYWAILLAACAILHHVVEKPARRLIIKGYERLVSKKQAAS